MRYLHGFKNTEKRKKRKLLENNLVQYYVTIKTRPKGGVLKWKTHQTNGLKANEFLLVKWSRPLIRKMYLRLLTSLTEVTF
jgi:hypothetical protein